MVLYDYTGNPLEISSSGGSVGVVTIAASNSTAEDKEKADFVCDGVNDQVELQAAIDSFGELSGVIQLANGTYNIDSFTQHDGYYYGLYFAKYKHEIIIRGVSHNHKDNNTSFAATNKAAVINVTSSAFNALPSDQESYVIGSNREWAFPYKVVGLESVTIAIPNYTKPVIGIDGAYLACMHVEHCFFKTGGSYSDPTGINPKCIAIRGCPQGNIGYNYYVSHVKIIGWGTGFQVAGEALQIIDTQVQRAAYGFVFGDVSDLNTYPKIVGMHPITMIACGASYCNRCAVLFGSVLNSGNESTVTIIDFNSEVGSYGGWGGADLFRSDNPGDYRGEVTYRLLSTSTWKPADVNIWANNNAGSYWKTTNLHSRRSGSTSQRPSDPCYLSEYYDTTLGKKIIYNGSNWIDASGTAV